MPVVSKAGLLLRIGFVRQSCNLRLSKYGTSDLNNIRSDELLLNISHRIVFCIAGSKDSPF